MSREYKINNGKIEFTKTNPVLEEVSKEEIERRIARYSNLINIAEKELERLKSEYSKLKAELPEVIKLEKELLDPIKQT